MSNELITLTELPAIPENWNYDESVAKVKQLIYKWKSLTAELATELWVARRKLSSRYHRDDGANAPSWSEYCEAVGSEKSTVNRWLARFFPRQIGPAAPLPKLPAQVLYADPPWQYANSGFDQSAEQHYPTLAVKDICNYRDPQGKAIKELPLEKAVLFLWVTYPLAPDGFEVLKAWGFDYKAQMVWVKNRGVGIGWWVNPRHELLYIASKGTELHPAVKYDSVFEYEATGHSRKPIILYEWIEKMYSGPYIELFARNVPPEQRRPNWSYWGNQVGT